MGVGTPAVSMPCSRRRGSPRCVVHDLSAAVPCAASAAQMPSITLPARAQSATAAALRRAEGRK
jgi:hypothetical protein